MVYQWEKEVRTDFLDRESLLNVLPYLCKSESDSPRASSHDPITSVVIVCLTCPLQLTLTEVGVMPFTGRCHLIYPYNLMTDRHKEFLRRCLARTCEWNIYNDAVVFRRSKEPMLLEPLHVLTALCQKVFESGSRTAQERPERDKTLVGLCNIILQRVQGYIPIHKTVQRELNEWLDSRSASADV